MIRFFDTFNETTLGIGNGGIKPDIPLYSLNTSRTNFSVIPTDTLPKNTGWKVNSYAYDESDGSKYLQVGANQWVKFTEVDPDRVVGDGGSADFQMAVYRDLQTTTTVVVEKKRDGIREYDIDYYDEYGNVSYASRNDGADFYADKQLEVPNTQKHSVAFRVSNNMYFEYSSIFVDNVLKFSNSNEVTTDSKVQPIANIIRVTSVIPDIFDSNGKAVKYPVDAGQQILSDGIYVTPERVGYRIAKNTFINLDSASGTTLMYGHFLPKMGE